MWRLAVWCIACAIAWGAEGSWQRVKDLKIGSDIRVYKKGSTKPMSAKAAGASNDKLFITIKKEQSAIDKAEIDRIDYHPPGSKPAKSETRTITTDGAGTNNDSYSSGYSWSREGWQTVYQK